MPKIVDREKYKNNLLSKCYDIFSKDGFSNTSMRQLGDKLKVSTGALYHYFPSKEAIFQDLVQYVASNNILKAEREIPNHFTLNERIEYLFHYVEKNQEQFLKWIFLLFEYKQWNKGNDNTVLEKAGIEYCKAIAKIIGLEDLEIGKLFFGFLNGLLVESLIDKREFSFKKQSDLFKKIITAYYDS